MGLGEMIFNWFFGFATIGGVILAIIVASYLRDKYNKKIGPHWENAIIPSIAFLLTHLTVWWMWPKYWTPFYMSNGFMLLQVMAVFGIYAISLSNKPAKAIGKALVYVAVAGLLVNVWGVYRTLHPTAPTPPPTVTNVTRGHWSNYVTDKNRGVADEVVVFFRSELPPADADLMTQICYEESRFRQFEEDGVTPLHGKVNPADTGVCQINMDVWKEELDQLGPEFNPDSLEGSLNAALWIFRKEGADKWVTYPKALYVLKKEIPPQSQKEIVRVSNKEEPLTAKNPREETFLLECGKWTGDIPEISRYATITSNGPIVVSDEIHSNHKMGVVEELEINFGSRIALRNRTDEPGLGPCRLVTVALKRW